MELAIKKALLLFSFSMFSMQGAAQQAPWDDYGVHISKTLGVSPESADDVFGESVDLYNGTVSFSETDIDLKGSSGLPVRLSRKYRTREFASVVDGLFADWELDTPYISGVFAWIYRGDAGRSEHSWSGQRCSGPRQPPYIALLFPALDYWYGLSVNIANGGALLEPAINNPQPSAGGPYKWVTPGQTWLSCLPVVNNTEGEGFLAITPDGTKYWFNWMAVYGATPLERYTTAYTIGGEPFPVANELSRRKHVLYATRVEDKYGNWVVYNYSNSPDSYGKLNYIESNDGRRIDIAYDSAGRIVSAAAGSQIWTYFYANGRLSAVNLPDQSRWVYDFSELNSSKASTENFEDATCSFPTQGNGLPLGMSEVPMVAKITSPSNLYGEFQIERRLHGRSNVPRNCLSTGEMLLGNPEVGTYSDYVRMYWTLSLTKKIVSGPGVDQLVWSYKYNNAFSLSNVLQASLFYPNPAPVGSWAAGGAYNNPSPYCISDNCAGRVTTEVTGPGATWARYTFGNSYRYDEHKLLKVEYGNGPGAVERIEHYYYDLRTSGAPYPTPVGYTAQYKGDDYMESFIRPLREKVIIQNGVAFRWTVNEFDSFARPLRVTQSNSAFP